MARYLDITGRRYGIIQVIEYTRTHNGAAYWRCRCDCGKEYEVNGNSLTRGRGCKSCGCMTKYKVAAALRKKDPTEASRNNAYNVFLRNARKRDLENTLSYEDWFSLTQQPCNYCGAYKSNCNRMPRVVFKRNACFYYNGIDRVDNELGYTLENSVACCKNCNFAKHSIGAETFLRLVKNIYEYRGLQNLC